MDTGAGRQIDLAPAEAHAERSHDAAEFDVAHMPMVMRRCLPAGYGVLIGILRAPRADPS